MQQIAAVYRFCSSLQSSIMPTEHTIFYSWQSDLSNSSNRNFILRALENAVKALRTEETIEVEPVLDRDTAGVSGSPDITGTIFSKIEQAEVFVCDVSIINSSAGERPTPNPNVLVELGYAAKALGWERIVMVMNTANGTPESLPFDLRSRRVLGYEFSEALCNSNDKVNRRRMLESSLRTALRSILTEVSQAGSETALALQFATHDSRQELGSSITVYSTVYEKPHQLLPDLRNWQSSGVAGIRFADPINRLNVDYWREKEEYIRLLSLAKPVGMLIQNQSDILLKQARVEIKGTVADRVFVSKTLPREPAYNHFDSISRSIPNFRFSQRENQVEVLKHGDQWIINLKFGDVQPKASIWLNDPFYIGSIGAEQLQMNALVYADNLPNPRSIPLLVSFETEFKPSLTIQQLETMPPYEN
jgi:hypothetical protein